MADITNPVELLRTHVIKIIVTELDILFEHKLTPEETIKVSKIVTHAINLFQEAKDITLNNLYEEVKKLRNVTPTNKVIYGNVKNDSGENNQ